MLKLSQEKERQKKLESKKELERPKFELEKQKQEVDKQVAIEHFRRDTEQAKIALQTARLGLVRDSKLSGAVLCEEGSSLPSGSSDIGSNLELSSRKGIQMCFFTLCLSRLHRQETGQTQN